MRQAAHAPVRAPSRTNVRFAVTYAVQSANKKTKIKKTANATPKRTRDALPRPQGVSRRRRRRTLGIRRRAPTYFNRKSVLHFGGFFNRVAPLNPYRTGRCVRLGALTGACAALRNAAAVCLAGYCAAVIPAGWPVADAKNQTPRSRRISIANLFFILAVSLIAWRR